MFPFNPLAVPDVAYRPSLTTDRPLSISVSTTTGDVAEISSEAQAAVAESTAEETSERQLCELTPDSLSSASIDLWTNEVSVLQQAEISCDSAVNVRPVGAVSVADEHAHCSIELPVRLNSAPAACILAETSTDNELLIC